MTIDVTTITVAQFKAQFFRGFPYLPNYDASATYNTGAEVYLASSGLFYSALVDGIHAVTPGTDGTKWTKATDDIDNWVQDADIANAFVEAQAVFNPALYQSDATVQLAYLYLTAHFLCHDMKAALAGLTAAGTFPVNSRSVGSVSESFAIPAAYTENPILAQYTGSSYGMKFLSITLPALVGNVGAIAGGTLP